MTAQPDLTGMRIVVVEDDTVLANAICRDLREVGATVLGPAPTPFYATQLIGRRKIDAAVLDLYLHGEAVFGVADLLLEQGVAILFLTSYEGEPIPARFRGCSVMAKPVEAEKLIGEIVATTQRPKAPKIAASMPAILSRQAPMQTFARALARGISSTN